MRLMKFFCALVAILAASLLALSALSAQQKSPMTNPDVIKMVKSEMTDSNIAAAIAASDTQFDLSSTGLQGLSQAGVSSKLIRAMLAAESKKKDAAAAAESSPPAQAAAMRQGSVPDGSQGMAGQGMPQGMSPDQMQQMQQMMNNMPPEMRERMQASMAQRNAKRSARGGGSANSIPSHAGVPVPMDSVLYTSFARLKTQPGCHMVMTMQTNDPKMAAIAQIYSVRRKCWWWEIRGNTRCTTKCPPRNVPGIRT